MYKKYWLGSNELVITQRNGTHHVIEKFEKLENSICWTN